MPPNKPELVERLEEAGFTLALTDAQELKVSPASRLTSTMRDEIRLARPVLIDWLLSLPSHDPFIEPPGYEGTGWRLAGAKGFSNATLAKFFAASKALTAGGMA